MSEEPTIADVRRQADEINAYWKLRGVNAGARVVKRPHVDCDSRTLYVIQSALRGRENPSCKGGGICAAGRGTRP